MNLVPRSIYLGLILSMLGLLGFVHQQTSIYRISYSITAKERELTRLHEEFTQAKVRLAELRSPNALRARAEEVSLDLTIPKDQEVIRLLRMRPIASRTAPERIIGLPFMSWFRFIKEAQAKTSK